MAWQDRFFCRDFDSTKIPSMEVIDSIADIIDAFEGPIAITDCSSRKCHCKHESHCATGLAWQDINVSIRDLLNKITLADMENNKKKYNAPSEFAGMAIHVENEVN